MPLDAAELAALRARLDAANPGPWLESYIVPGEEVFLAGEPRYRRVARTGVEHAVYGPDIGEDRVMANGELIVALRNDADALLDAAGEALRLREAMDRLAQERFDDLAAAQTERDRLAAALRTYGEHKAACRVPHEPCDPDLCGLDAALTPTAPGAAPPKGTP